MTVKIDAQTVVAAYSGVLNELRRLTGFSQTEVLRGEAGIILKTAAGRTKVASQQVASLRARVRAIRNLGFSGGKRNAKTSEGGANISINSGLRGPYGRVFIRKKDATGGKTKAASLEVTSPRTRVRSGRRRGLSSGKRNVRTSQVGSIQKKNATGSNQWRRTHDAGFVPLWQHYKKGDWIDLQEAIHDVKIAVAHEEPLAKQSVGLARQSWIQIADALGIDLATVRGGGTLSASGITKARNAIASNGQSYVNGAGVAGGDENKAYVDLINRLPYSARVPTTNGRGFDPLLGQILAGRVKQFETAYARGAFDSIKNTIRVYPWVKALTPPLPIAA